VSETTNMTFFTSGAGKYGISLPNFKENEIREYHHRILPIYSMFHGVLRKQNSSLWPYMQSQHLFSPRDVLRNKITCAE